MKQSILKMRLILFIVRSNLWLLLTRRLNLPQVLFALKKQRILAKMFSHAKYSKVGPKIFVDPFAPYFPSPYFQKVLQNNTIATPPFKPNYAQISITHKCPCHCFHCHVQNTNAIDLPAEKIITTIEQMIAADFPLIFFVGGEPMSRFHDLLDFIRAAHPQMDTRIFTSGVGASRERLVELKKAGLQGICVSIDHHDPIKHNQQREHPLAFSKACDTVRWARELGFYVSVVTCVTKTMVHCGDLEKMVDLAEQLGGHSIQLNEIRPVGAALTTADSSTDIFLTDKEKRVLIDFYRRQNKSQRSIAIVMPWYNETPAKFGCTATAGQKVYVDAYGHVQPCELLKTSIGNITHQSFTTIWEKFRRRCGYPVKDCIIYPLNALITRQKGPLAPAETYANWPKMVALEPTDQFKTIRLPNSSLKEMQDFRAYYDLTLVPGIDYTVFPSHWLAKYTNLPIIAWGRALYFKEPLTYLPYHEYLHLAQFHKFGIFRVLCHYIYHGGINWLQTRKLKTAFAQIPFEVEARQYQALCYRQRDMLGQVEE